MMKLAHYECASSGEDMMIDSGFRDVTGRVKHLLAASPIADLRHIKVVQQGDQVLLQGRVRSFYAKQMAQETVRRAINGMHLVNAVCVD
jgi:osmotically-inducible protein OsmY